MKAFIIIDTERQFGEEYKARTESGTEVWVKRDELIPFVEFSKNKDTAKDFGFVKINGVAMTAEQVKTYMQIHEGILKQYEDLKEAYRKNEKIV